MSKLKITREVKVGVTAVIAVFVLYFGLNFLKGVDIFKPITYYYAVYDNIGGLVPSSPVNVKGLKVGQIEEIQYDFTREKSFVVKFSVSRDIVLPKNAIAELYDDGLMGGKAMQLVFPPYLTTSAMYTPGDTVQSNISAGLMAQVAGDLMPKIESISNQADSLLRAVRVVVEGKSLNNSLGYIENMTSELASTSRKLNKMVDKDLPGVLKDVKQITGDMKNLTGNLSKIDYAATLAQIDLTVRDLKEITRKINDSEGTMGLLINDKSLYVNLSNTMADTDNLLIDLKKNPKRYVHFSLFGAKSEK